MRICLTPSISSQVECKNAKCKIGGYNSKIAVDVAIQRKSKISTMPDWPRIDIKIYDMEKTVVDIVFYRERVGIEETKEVLINYLHRKDRNLNQLIRYAELLKCSDVMKTYLEVLV